MEKHKICGNIITPGRLLNYLRRLEILQIAILGARGGGDLYKAKLFVVVVGGGGIKVKSRLAHLLVTRRMTSKLLLRGGVVC